MLLNVNDERFFENPNAITVRDAITELAADEFAVLNRGDEDYVQTYHNEDGTFLLEFRAGSADEHYAAETEELTVSEIAMVFEQYLANQHDWKSKWQWEKVEFDDDFEGDLTEDDAYLLNGEEFRKIVVGDERLADFVVSGKCPECDAKLGDYHFGGCTREECPRCHGLLLECDCE